MALTDYRILTWTQRWSRIDGAWYRDAHALRLADGQHRIIAVLDES